MTEHTPGPWNKKYDKYGECWEVYVVKTGVVVGYVYGTGYNDTDEANARLIAAAPDMVARIEKLERHVKLLRKALDETMFAYDFTEVQDIVTDALAATEAPDAR